MLRSGCRPIRKIRFGKGEKEKKLPNSLIFSFVFFPFSSLPSGRSSYFFLLFFFFFFFFFFFVFFLMTFILQLPVDTELRHPTLCAPHGSLWVYKFPFQMAPTGGRTKLPEEKKDTQTDTDTLRNPLSLFLSLFDHHHHHQIIAAMSIPFFHLTFRRKLNNKKMFQRRRKE